MVFFTGKVHENIDKALQVYLWDILATLNKKAPRKSRGFLKNPAASYSPT
jgi:hypothetical protein